MTNQSKPHAMVREERYIVIKRKDLEAASGDSHTGVSEAEVALRDHLDSWQVGTRAALVIESDWPEYEPAWRMIEARVNGTEQPPAVGGEPEVLGYCFVDRFDHREFYQLDSITAKDRKRHGFVLTELIDRAHVAPLLAEIEHLKDLMKSVNEPRRPSW